MKTKRIFLLCAALLLISTVLLSSCNKDNTSDETVYYTVTFNSNGGTPVEPKKAAAGDRVGEPGEPVREGYVFDGWLYKNLPWTFVSDRVNEDITLTAKWIDAKQIFKYTPNGDGTATITGYTKLPRTVFLPSSIAGYKVVAVGEGAFKGLSNEDIASITVPNTITSVGDEAFANCQNIPITFEGELENIGEAAFLKCNKLRTVSFGKGLKKISADAFKESGLSNITLPSGVISIDENAFEACTSLTTVVLHSSLQTIGDSTFYETGIKAVYIYGTDSEAEEFLSRNEEFRRNDKFFDAKIYLYSETEPTSDTQFDGLWHYDTSNQIKIW